MTKLRTCACKALGKVAGLSRSAPLELMAHGGLAADPQVFADLSTVRVWHRRILGLCSGSVCGSGSTRPDFEVSTAAYRQLKLDGQSQKED
eukprot:5761351-Amphidinium_carterae.1